MIGASERALPPAFYCWREAVYCQAGLRFTHRRAAINV